MTLIPNKSSLDLIGQKVGKLTIIEKTKERLHNSVLWRASCECGGERLISSHQFKYQKVKSCGCTRKGYRKTREYTIWANMIQRCNNENSPRYNDYGGRNIKVCEEWTSAINFIEWAHNNGYEDNLSLERIDVNGNYEPSNCTWIELDEQAKNKRNSIKVIIDNEELSLKEASIKYNVPKQTIYDRYKAGKKDKDLIKRKGRL